MIVNALVISLTFLSHRSQPSLSAIDCSPVCGSCTGATDSKCLSCSDPDKMMMLGACVTQCPDGYYENQTLDSPVCTICHQSCATCSASDDVSCLTCSAESRFPVFQESKCLQECHTGRFPDTAGECQVCHEECHACSGKNADQCTACQGTVLLGSACVVVCPSGYSTINGECL